MADPITIGLGVAGLLTSIFGGGGNSTEQRELKRMIEELEAQGIPSVEAQKLALDKYVQQGKLDPKLEETYKQVDSEFNKIKLDPKYKETQMRALGELEKLGYEGGMTLEDKANLQGLKIDAAATDRGRREAITDNMERRGAGTSGAALAAQLAGAQQTGDREAQNALTTAAQARARGLSAIMGAGELGGKLQSQDWSMESDKAAAADAINRFNTTLTQDVRNRNATRQNQAQEYNLNLKQDIHNKNTGLSNFEQQYNKELLQKQFDNEMKKRQAAIDGQKALVSNEQTNNQNNANLWSNVGGAVAELGNTSAPAKAPAVAGKTFTPMPTMSNWDDDWNNRNNKYKL